MKYCLSSRVGKKFLDAADEIKVAYRDINQIYDLIEDYPNKTIILKLDFEQDINWTEVQSFSEIYPGKFICACETLTQLLWCGDLGIKKYYDFPITSYYDLNAVKDLGVEYALISIPLCFDLPTVKDFHIPIRMVPNIAYDRYLLHDTGICGQWIRPEDVPVYEEYVETLEFRAESVAKEETLYHVYAENGYWPTDLSTLIDDLDFPCENSAIPADVIEARIKCKHACQTGRCHLCENAFKFSSAVRLYSTQKKNQEVIWNIHRLQKFY